MSKHLHAIWITVAIVTGLLLLFVAPKVLGQLPTVNTQGGVSYLSGGIGDDEEVEIRRAAKDFGVLLEFSEVERGTSHGRWTADVKISIKSGTSTVLTAVADGPLMLVKLQPGIYVAEAERQGVKQMRRFEVKANAVTRDRIFWIVDESLNPR